MAPRSNAGDPDSQAAAEELKTDRSLYAQCFRDLTREFRESLESVQSVVERFGKTLAACQSPDDLRKNFDSRVLTSLLHRGESVADLLANRRQTVQLFTERKAWDCGIDHRAPAARIVLEAINLDLLKAPPKLWRQVRHSGEPLPQEGHELRRFWQQDIVRLQTLLMPYDVGRLLRYPSGRTARLARAGRITFIRLPDGQIRFEQAVIEGLLVHAGSLRDGSPRLPDVNLTEAGCRLLPRVHPMRDQI